MMHKEVVKCDSCTNLFGGILQKQGTTICHIPQAYVLSLLQPGLGNTRKYSTENDVTYPSFRGERQRAADLEGERDGGEEF
jgi:hypothetical protein